MSDVLLEVRGIRRAIGDRTLLSSLSFQVEDEDVLFVRGPSGVGKTLLLRALACLDPLQVRPANQLCRSSCLSCYRPRTHPRTRSQ